MGKKFIYGLIALFVLLAAGYIGYSFGFDQTATEPPTSDSERTIITETGSLPHFSVLLPDGWQHETRQGIDTQVGVFTNNELELMYDYGDLASRDYEDNPDYSVREGSVHGQQVLFVQRDESEATESIFGVYFPGSMDRPPLNINTTDALTDTQRETVMGIFGSVRFE